jgi:putative acetyltransferase
MHLRIVEAGPLDLATTLRVERAAFGQEEEAELVAALLQDPTAKPHLSLLALVDDIPAGHVLFTAVAVEGANAPGSAAILAPLAVAPGFQRQGVGRALIEDGVRRLTASGVRIVFVLGDPAYYGRSGFKPAVPLGFVAPYPIKPEEAWMVRDLLPQSPATAPGRVSCARSLDKPEYWRE